MRITVKKRDSVRVKELITEAEKILGEYRLGSDEYTAGSVAAALLSSNGNLYTGINFDVACGIGFCAEHAAVAQMLKHRETRIDMIVALNANGVIPPCGRCRELLFQINNENSKTKIYLSEENYMTLDELLPNRWEPSKNQHNKI